MEFLARLSADNTESPEHKARVQVYHAFIIGLIKGSLVNLGAEGPIDCRLKMVYQETMQFPKLQIDLTYMERNKKNWYLILIID